MAYQPWLSQFFCTMLLVLVSKCKVFDLLYRLLNDLQLPQNLWEFIWILLLVGIHSRMPWWRPIGANPTIFSYQCKNCSNCWPFNHRRKDFGVGFCWKPGATNLALNFVTILDGPRFTLYIRLAVIRVFPGGLSTISHMFLGWIPSLFA